MKAYGLEQDLEQVNKNAAASVKEAIARYRSKTGSSRRVFIAADIGPLGQLLEPSGTISKGQATDYFSQQIEVMARERADIILIETVMDINEAFAAIEAARQVAADLPILCTLTFGKNGVTMMGNKAEDAVKQLQEAGASVVGANCSLGSVSMLDIARKMRESDKDAKLIFQPNAGLPVLKDGQTTYNESAAEMAENISKYLQYSPSIIGACCGSTPQHIREIIKAVS
ncbi:MAG: homocysteine S-methyltransferase family protein [Actinomycetota bacterium]|nr:homocysteine S-methyltransferase family protein [Actinomycetota bacterium]